MVFWQGTIVVDGFSMVFFTSEPLLSIGTNGFQWFCSPATIGPDGFSMVSNGS